MRGGPQTNAPSNQQGNGGERLQELCTGLRLRNRGILRTEVVCKSSLQFLSLDQQKENHKFK